MGKELKRSDCGIQNAGKARDVNESSLKGRASLPFQSKYVEGMSMFAEERMKP
jgi:hypothetical protein